MQGSDYVNASSINVSESKACEPCAKCHCPQGYKVRNAYIAAQAPLQNTVEDFWRMVWENKCRVIVMLYHLDEVCVHVTMCACEYVCIVCVCVCACEHVCASMCVHALCVHV